MTTGMGGVYVSDIACWDGWLLGRTYICLMVHNNIKGAKGAFLGGITGTGRISKEVWGTGLSPLGDG